MKRLRKLILALGIAGACFGADAITLQECQQLARENYPLLQAYDVIDLTSRYTIEAAGRAWIPQVGVNAQASWQNNVASFPDLLNMLLEMQGVEVKGMRHDQYRIGIDVSQTIYEGGRIKASKDVTRGECNENRAATDVELYALNQRVDEVYFSILLLGKQLGALDNSVNLLKANVELMESMYREGVVMQSDIDEVRAELLTVQQQKANVEATDMAYRRILALYIGRQSCPELEEPVISAPSGIRPELQLFAAQEALTQARMKQVKASTLPTIGAFATGFYGYPGFNSLEAIVNNNWTFNFMVGARINWDISSLYTRNSKLNTLKAKARSIEIQRNTFLFNQELQETSGNENIARLERIAREDEEIVSLRRNVRMAEEAKLREGIINATELLRKITEERNAVITSETHRIEILQARQKLNYIKGL